MNASQSAERGTSARRPIVIGDRIEQMGNKDCLRHAAEMFDWQPEFFDDDDHTIDLRALSRSGYSLVAIENTPDARNLFHFRPPSAPLAVIVGNERKGIPRRDLRLADYVLQIPVASAHLNTLNVAAAAAVAMEALSRGRDGRISAGGGRARGRPDVMLAGAGECIELGSAVRSAACFGWTRLYIDDPHRAWFDADRVTRSLGRGAARRGRNAIHVLPASAAATYDDVIVIGSRGDGAPLRRTDLARGSRQLAIIVDEQHPFDERDALRFGCHVQHASLQIEHGQRHPFRLVASIALAEIARQVGGFRRS